MYSAGGLGLVLGRQYNVREKGILLIRPVYWREEGTFILEVQWCTAAEAVKNSSGFVHSCGKLEKLSRSLMESHRQSISLDGKVCLLVPTSIFKKLQVCRLHPPYFCLVASGKGSVASSYIFPHKSSLKKYNKALVLLNCFCCKTQTPLK